MSAIVASGKLHKVTMGHIGKRRNRSFISEIAWAEAGHWRSHTKVCLCERVIGKNIEDQVLEIISTGSTETIEGGKRRFA